MIPGMSSNNSVLNMMYMLNASMGGKLALPVAPASLIYSYFKNVSGVPAAEGNNGVTITKLNILNVLIEQMNQFRKTSGIAAPLSDDSIDAMIDSYRTQITMAKNSKSAQPLTAPMFTAPLFTMKPLAESGSLYSLSA